MYTWLHSSQTVRIICGPWFAIFYRLDCSSTFPSSSIFLKTKNLQMSKHLYKGFVRYKRKLQKQTTTFNSFQSGFWHNNQIRKNRIHNGMLAKPYAWKKSLLSSSNIVSNVSKSVLFIFIHTWMQLFDIYLE